MSLESIGIAILADLKEGQAFVMRVETAVVNGLAKADVAVDKAAPLVEAVTAELKLVPQLAAPATIAEDVEKVFVTAFDGLSALFAQIKQAPPADPAAVLQQAHTIWETLQADYQKIKAAVA